MHTQTYAKAVAAMLRQELRLPTMSIKAIMNWTSAGERTVKGWVGAANGPRGEHLIALMQRSDMVFDGVVGLAGREVVVDRHRLMLLRRQLLQLVKAIDAILD